jgi:hypothetical protein
MHPCWMRPAAAGIERHSTSSAPAPHQRGLHDRLLQARHPMLCATCRDYGRGAPDHRGDRPPAGYRREQGSGRQVRALQHAMAARPTHHLCLCAASHAGHAAAQAISMDPSVASPNTMCAGWEAAPPNMPAVRLSPAASASVHKPSHAAKQLRAPGLPIHYQAAPRQHLHTPANHHPTPMLPPPCCSPCLPHQAEARSPTMAGLQPGAPRPLCPAS